MKFIRYTGGASTCEHPESFPSRLLLILGGGLWIFFAVVGFFFLGKEEFTPAPNAPNLSVFPHDSTIALASDKLTLLLFAHPLCPCTRASLHELDELLEDTHNKLSVIVVFTIPTGVAPGWEKGELWTLARKMTAIRVLRDQDGKEAKLFGVEGSGHVLLYNPAGELLFSGGITPSRGHEGDNEGRAAVTSLVLTGHTSIHRTPVFGCSLL